MLTFECAVTCYRTLFIMSDIKTMAETNAKIKTNIDKDKMAQAMTGQRILP